MPELDAEQRAAAESPAPVVFVNAGPGAGKTLILAARVARLIESGAYIGPQIAALTYSRKMAADLRRRIVEALPESTPCTDCGGAGTIGSFTCATCSGLRAFKVAEPAVGTLHSLAAGWVRRALAGKLAGGAAIAALGWTTSPDFAIAQPEDVDDIIDAAHKELGRRVNKRDLRRGLRARGTALATFTPATEARRQLRIRGLVTYDDLLVMLEEMLRAPREPVGPPHLADVVPCLIVDEAQDLSPRHWRIIDAWAPRSLTAAGDDAQAIYGFMHEADADDASLADVPTFGARLARAAARFEIGRNYRSVASIVVDCRRVRRALAADGACADLALEPVRPDESAAVVVEQPVGCDWPQATAEHVEGILTGPEHLWGAVRAYQPHDVAVLARTWAELEEVAAALQVHGIPHALPERGRDRWRTLAGRAVVACARTAARGFLDEQDARTVLRALGHSSPDAILSRALDTAIGRRRPLVEVLDEMPVTRAALPDRWWRALVEARTTGALAAQLAEAEALGGPALVKAAALMASWRPDYEACDEDDAPAPATPGDWLVWLASDETNAAVELREGHVVLSTFHGAKGLEWPAVVVVGACEGSLPGRMDKTEADRLEAGRTLYVGMTRARDVLRVVCPSELRGKPRAPSPWLVVAGLV